MKLYIIRHAESEANVANLLAGRLDSPLSPRGARDANDLARSFLAEIEVEAVISSPLVRAMQTARPFVLNRSTPLFLDDRLLEHDIGIFTGKTYEEAESDPRYEKRRDRRWDWLPEGGESYRMIADRAASFLGSLDFSYRSCLVVTHAVTMRLLRAALESTLPVYPTELAKNGEIWETEFTALGNGHEIRVLSYGHSREHRA